MQQALFERYIEFLLKWNQKYNLTAIIDPKEIRIKHFEDSLSLLPFLPRGCRLLDIGTGAGFPGIPIKIERPDLEITLLDSRRKKIAFCDALILELALKKIKTFVGRAQDPKTKETLGLFDVVVSRATTSLTEFLSLSRNFLDKGGIAIAMKGPDWKKEYQEISTWKLKKVFDYELSEGLGKRSLVIFVYEG